MKTVIILGSSRRDGETKKVIDELVALTQWDVIDLNDYDFSYYDYEHKNIDDDYIGLMRKILEYDLLVFATPVYWYAMSGIMKVFFDRVTDLLDFEQELGRKLRSKSMAAVSCSIGNHLDDQFWLPFRETAAYLGMKYVGNLHAVANKNQTEKIKAFIGLVGSHKP
ncbi:MAG TPA: NAD(P)H-dependent oxidoreductase [Cyclobacteriaceae bacterium]|nr:NAD(P)H-dependent oxidoreductase [Cyclobacteriaceae bacterium]